MNEQMTIEQIRVHAYAAAKSSSRWIYETTYAGGGHTISRREPDDFAIHLSGFGSFHYAKHAGVSTATALRHLRKLVKAGYITERDRLSTACRFDLPEDHAADIGREHIAELRAEGLPFDDEWRKQKGEGRV